MIKGMTGFGYAQVSNDQIKAVVEVKTLNHRYFDINYYLPIGFGSMENKIRQIVQKEIERGRVTVSVKITQKPSQNISLNKNIVKKHIRHINGLKREFKLKDDLKLSDIITLPGVLEVKETLLSPESVWRALEKGLCKALKDLIVMRKREGRSIAADVTDKLNRMLLQINKIRKRAKIILRDKKKVLSPEEFTSFQKSCDINEELARAKHYVDEIKLLLKSNVSIGKRVDFIAQEMQRETNTIGSKLQDKVVSNAVIALKSKVEKIREQAQNIE